MTAREPPVITSSKPGSDASPTLGAGGIAVAGVALVVSGSTLVTDFTGFASLGIGFALSVIIGLAVVIPVVFSASDLAVSHPLAGGIYQFARSVMRGKAGETAGLFLAMLFLGTFLIGATGETKAAAHALKELVGSRASETWFSAIILIGATIPNLLGLRKATWVTGVLLFLMIGIRLGFGAAGFSGISETGGWRFSNLFPLHGLDLFGSGGVVLKGISLGFWCFVGIEGASSLVEETKDPRRSIPVGLLIGLGVILVTTLVMGVGVIGCFTPVQLHAVTAGFEGTLNEAPHLAIGRSMFGSIGFGLMASASIASTLSTLLIAIAAVPRMIAALARDGHFPSPLSHPLGRLDAKTGAPIVATITVTVALLLLSFCCDRVLESLRVAAYLWFIRHIIVHMLAIANRAGGRLTRGIMGRRTMIVVAACGILATSSAFFAGFHGTHRIYLPQLLTLAAAAAAVVFTSLLFRNFPNRRATVTESANNRRFRLKNPEFGSKQTIDIAPRRPVLAHSQFGIAR